MRKEEIPENDQPAEQYDTMTASRPSCKAALCLLLRCLKWSVIFGCIGFVIWGWHNSVKKFTSGQTAIGITMDGSTLFKFPSITLCKRFREDFGREENLVDRIAKVAGERHVDSLYGLDLNEIIANISYQRADFLTIFSHNELGGAKDHLLNNESNWRRTIPHPSKSGLCFTYDPQFRSAASKYFGIRFGLKFAESVNKSQWQKEEELSQLNIFIHDQGQFMFYEEDDRPSSSKLDTSQFRYMKDTEISLKFSSLTRLSTSERKCEIDQSYSFQLCLERYFSKRRGCQAPWFYFEELGIPMCSNVSEIQDKFKNSGEGEFFWNSDAVSTEALANDTGCKLPCTSNKYRTEISTAKLEPWIFGDVDFGVSVYFKNFQFQRDQEYVVCDWSCLLGELGGNLGFFLGGSLLAYLNFFLDPVFAWIGK